jgi:hypothetical protein
MISFILTRNLSSREEGGVGVEEFEGFEGFEEFEGFERLERFEEPKKSRTRL